MNQLYARLIDRAFQYLENITGIDFQKTTNANLSDIDFTDNRYFLVLAAILCDSVAQWLIFQVVSPGAALVIGPVLMFTLASLVCTRGDGSLAVQPVPERAELVGRQEAVADVQRRLVHHIGNVALCFLVIFTERRLKLPHVELDFHWLCHSKTLSVSMFPHKSLVVLKVQ